MQLEAAIRPEGYEGAGSRARTPINGGGGIVILATQRSGSTLLCDGLHRVGFGRGEEHVLKLVVRRSEIPAFVAGTYGPQVTRRFDAARLGRRGLHRGHYCTKIMANYLPSLCGLYCGSAPIRDAGWQADALQVAFPGCLFVFLTRTDRLGQAISRVMAANTGICHAAGALPGYVTARSVDAHYNRSVIFRALDVSGQLSGIDSEQHALCELRYHLDDRGAAVQTMLYDGHWFAAADRSGDAPVAAAEAVDKLLDLPPHDTGLRKLANCYNSWFENAYHAYCESTSDASPRSTADQVRATIAALSACTEHDAEWVCMQADFIARKQYV